MVFRKLHEIKPKKKRHYMCIGKNTEDNKLEFDLITCF